jgi:hypothetical protein
MYSGRPGNSYTSGHRLHNTQLVSQIICGPAYHLISQAKVFDAVLKCAVGTISWCGLGTCQGNRF